MLLHYIENGSELQLLIWNWHKDTNWPYKSAQYRFHYKGLKCTLLGFSHTGLETGNLQSGNVYSLTSWTAATYTFWKATFILTPNNLLNHQPGQPYKPEIVRGHQLPTWSVWLGFYLNESQRHDNTVVKIIYASLVYTRSKILSELQHRNIKTHTQSLYAVQSD